AGPAVGEVVISEVYYHPTSNDFHQDFQDGTAEGFDRVRGSWGVIDGRYEVTPDDEGDAISIVSAATDLGSRYTLRMTIQIPDQETFNKNAIVLFDYRSPTDFKFASFHASSGKWRIGRRDADGWVFLAENKRKLEADRDYLIELEVDGSSVTVRSAGVTQVDYDFDEVMQGGQIGLGSKNGSARFDDFVFESGVREAERAFIEITNVANQAVDLAGWRLGGVIEFTFTGDTSLGLDASLVVVGFDPSDTGAAGAFRRAMKIDDAVVLVGPFAGDLDNRGDVVKLLRAGAPGDAGTRQVLVDRVAYDDRPPWPEEATGGGASLQRIGFRAFGDFAASWRGSAPTPGTSQFVILGDANRDGRVDADDVRAFSLGLIERAAYLETYGVPPLLHGDMDRDGDFDYDDIAGLIAKLDATTPSASAARSAVQTAAVAPDLDNGELNDAERDAVWAAIGRKNRKEYQEHKGHEDNRTRS
ncbi:MAG: lamin tail domain-containing protein, partial [Pirellulales bacterium]